MLITEGDVIDLGAPIRTSRTKHRFGEEFIFPTSASVYINYGVITRYNIIEDRVEITPTEYINSVLKLPLSFEPLGFGRLGIKSFMPPLVLPFDHPGHITELDQANVCVHRLTNERCRLRLHPDFPVSGGFTLAPINAPDQARSFTSMLWTRKIAEEHLETLRGSAPVGRGTVRGFVVDNWGNKVFRSSWSLNRLHQNRNKEEVTIVVAHPDLSINFFPVHLIQKSDAT